MDDYKHGTMDVSSKEDTFHGFMKWVVRVAIFAVFVLLFMAVFNS